MEQRREDSLGAGTHRCGAARNSGYTKAEVKVNLKLDLETD